MKIETESIKLRLRHDRKLDVEFTSAEKKNEKKKTRKRVKRAKRAKRLKYLNAPKANKNDK